MTYSMNVRSRPQFTDVDDLNNDRNNNLIIFKGYGNGSFSIITRRHSTECNSDPRTSAINDFDKDHIADVVITNNSTNHVLILASCVIYPNTILTDYRTGNLSNMPCFECNQF